MVGVEFRREAAGDVACYFEEETNGEAGEVPCAVDGELDGVDEEEGCEPDCCEEGECEGRGEAVDYDGDVVWAVGVGEVGVYVAVGFGFCDVRCGVVVKCVMGTYLEKTCWRVSGVCDIGKV